MIIVSVSAEPFRRHTRRITTFTGIVALFSTASLFVLAAPPKVGDRARAFELKGLDQSNIKLSSLIRKGPVVLILLRGYPGYQCPICTIQVGSLLSQSEKFEKSKAQVVLVYPGPADGLKAHADEFVQGKDIPKNFRFALDPDFAFTKKYDLRWDAPNETSYPSTFVLNRKGKIIFARISHSHGDRAKTDEILDALAKSR